MARERHAALRIIALYKLVKMLALLALAAVAFGLVREERFDALRDRVIQWPIMQGHGFVVHTIDRLLELDPHKFLAIGIAACVYAAVFAVEGLGLWFEKRWAEYLTTIVTASLIPFELWEIDLHFNWLKVGALALNVAIVLYLIALLRRGASRSGLR